MSKNNAVVVSQNSRWRSLKKTLLKISRTLKKFNYQVQIKRIRSLRKFSQKMMKKRFKRKARKLKKSYKSSKKRSTHHFYWIMLRMKSQITTRLSSILICIIPATQIMRAQRLQRQSKSNLSACLKILVIYTLYSAAKDR